MICQKIDKLKKLQELEEQVFPNPKKSKKYFTSDYILIFDDCNINNLMKKTNSKSTSDISCYTLAK